MPLTVAAGMADAIGAVGMVWGRKVVIIPLE